MTSIDEAISDSEKRARRFLIISVLWVVIMFAVAATFAFSIIQFNDTKHQILEMRLDLSKRISNIELITKQQEQRADQLIAGLQKTQDGLTALERSTLDKLDDHEKQIHALNLQKLEPDKLSVPQKEFIKEQAQKNPTNEKPTAPKLALEAYGQYVEGNYPRAIDIYTDALKLDPKFSAGYFGRGRVNYRIGNYEQAYDDLTHAIDLGGEVSRFDLFRLRAKALLFLGKIDAAQLDLMEASKSAPSKEWSLNLVGLGAMLTKDWQTAESNINAAANLVSQSRKIDFLENIGLIYLGQSNWERAYNWTIGLSNHYVGGDWNWMIMALAAEKLEKSKEREAAVARFRQSKGDRKESMSELQVYLAPDLRHLANQWVQ